MDIVIASLYILYGVVKLSLGLTVMLLPQDKIESTPIIKMFSKHSADKSFAGRFYEYVLLIFGCYTIMYGLNILNVIPEPYHSIIDKKETEYTVFIILGLALTIFYTLVLYTDVPISKQDDSRESYKVLGLFGGLSFLAMPIIWEMLEDAYPYFKSLPLHKKSLFILSSVILSIITIEFIYKLLYNESLIDIK